MEWKLTTIIIMLTIKLKNNKLEKLIWFLTGISKGFVEIRNEELSISKNLSRKIIL